MPNIKDYALKSNQGWSILDNNKFLLDWTGLEFGKPGAIGGVYLIGDFYVGRSKDLKKRILSHLRDALNNRHSNRQLGQKIKSLILSGHAVQVKILCTVNDQDLEARFYRAYTEAGYKLLNQEDPAKPSVPYYLKSKKN